MRRIESSPATRGSFGSGVLFISPRSRILLLRRSASSDQPGTWCGPGGGVENETIEEAARRETAEEVGFSDPYVLHHLARITTDGYVFHNHLAAVDHEFEPILNDEHDEFMWTASLPENLHPGLRLALDEFVSRNEPL